MKKGKNQVINLQPCPAKKRRHQKGLSFGLGLGLGLQLLACQPSIQPTSTAPKAQAHTQAVQQQSQPPAAAVAYQPKPEPYARLETVGSEKGPKQNLRLKFVYPQASKGFRTQAFGCGEVTFAKVWVAGSSLNAPLYADGADSQTHLLAATGCSLAVALSQVPYGNLVVSIQLYNAQGQLLTGSELKGALRLSNAAQNLELGYRQLPAGRLLEALLQGSMADRFLAGQIDLPALQSLFDSLMVVGNRFPNYSYQHHPSLINHSLLLGDLKAQNGLVSALSPDPRYIYIAGSVQLSLNGYLLNQDVSLSLDDTLSPNATVSANGAVTLTNVPPGTWQLRLSGPGYLSRQVPVTVQDQQQSAMGTVSIYPPQPSLTGLSLASGPWGSQVTLSGNHFNPTQANNTVRFGSTPATINSASLTALQVTVPNGLALGPTPISVTIGAAEPATGQSFEVLGPTITGLSTGQTLGGKAALLRGQTLTISGSHFSPVPAQNLVHLGPVSLAPSTASASQLTLTLPSSLTTPGDLTVSVVSNGQSSNGMTAIVPSIDLIFSGGFD